MATEDPDYSDCTPEPDCKADSMDTSEKMPDNPSNTITKMECDSSSEIDPEKALEFKNKGNDAFKSQEYESALELYSKSLRYNPNNAQTLSNRSAVYLQLKDYIKAMEDANLAIKIEESFVKSYFRLAKCHVASGNIVQAKVMFEKALALHPGNQCTINEITNCDFLMSCQEKYERAFEKGNFREVMFYINQVRSYSKYDAVDPLLRIGAKFGYRGGGGVVPNEYPIPINCKLI